MDAEPLAGSGRAPAQGECLHGADRDARSNTGGRCEARVISHPEVASRPMAQAAASAPAPPAAASPRPEHEARPPGRGARHLEPRPFDPGLAGGPRQRRGHRRPPGRPRPQPDARPVAAETPGRRPAEPAPVEGHDPVGEVDDRRPVRVTIEGAAPAERLARAPSDGRLGGRRRDARSARRGGGGMPGGGAPGRARCAAAPRPRRAARPLRAGSPSPAWQASSQLRRRGARPSAATSSASSAVGSASRRFSASEPAEQRRMFGEVG